MKKARKNFSLANGLIRHTICIEITYSNEVLFAVSFAKLDNETAEFDDFAKNIFLQLAEYFLGTRKEFYFNYELKGTEFQKKVWQALLTIPYGETVSYKDIAKKIGNVKAVRAVGMACHRNPIGILIPCHRVIAQNGSLGGYAEGIEIKKALLALEKTLKDI